MVFNFLLWSASPPLWCYKCQKSPHLSVFPSRKRRRITFRSEATSRTQESTLVFISLLRRANSKTITRKITQMEVKITTG